MSRIKRLVSDSLIYGLSTVISRFINYLLVPFYTDLFRTDEYGIVSLVFISIGILNVFFTFGMESAYLKLGSKYSEDRSTQFSVFKSLQTFLMAGSSVLLILLWLLKAPISNLIGLTGEYTQVYLFMLGILTFDTLAIIPMTHFRIENKAIHYGSLKIGSTVLNIALNFYLILQLKMGIEAIFISNLIASSSLFVIVNLIQSKMYKGVFNRDYLKEAVLFGLPFVPAGLAHLINESIDRYFFKLIPIEQLHHLYGAGITHEALIGIYSACYKLAVFMLLIVQMFRMAWQPFFLKQSKEKDTPVLFGKIFHYFNLLLCLAFAVISIYVKDIAALKIPFTNATIINEAYWGALIYVPALLLAYVFQGWYVVFTAGIFISSKTKILSLVTFIGAVITLVGNGIFTIKYGMIGAAYTTTLSYCCMSLLLFKLSQDKFFIQYRITRAFLVLGIAFGLVMLYTQMPILQSVALYKLLFTITGTACLLLVGYALWPVKKALK